ncbi:MAG TPA: lysophospholipid acyltransferase family protein [Oscillospiraceae bacterium]|nr:lysophospholipid acyltransferase family protein [Oscillospiraceae bacterium]
MAYQIFRRFFAVIFAIFFRWDVQGRENIPQEGPFIMCGNHFSWWDPPLLGAITPRFARFMAKEELIKTPILGTVLKAIKVFPVKRNSADRRAIKTALETLKAGHGLGIFPEGTRSHTNELLTPQAGVGLIAAKSEAPVIPIGIAGPYRLFHPIRVRIGTPLYFPEYYGVKVKGEELAKIAQRIMQEIDRLRKS